MVKINLGTPPENNGEPQKTSIKKDRTKEIQQEFNEYFNNKQQEFSEYTQKRREEFEKYTEKRKKEFEDYKNRQTTSKETSVKPEDNMQGPYKIQKDEAHVIEFPKEEIEKLALEDKPKNNMQAPHKIQRDEAHVIELPKEEIEKLALEDKPKEKPHMINYFNGTPEQKQSLKVDNNFNQINEECLESYNKQFDLLEKFDTVKEEYETLKKELNTFSNENLETVQDLKTLYDIKNRIRKKEYEILTLTKEISYIKITQNKLIDEGCQYIKFIVNWEDGKTSNFSGTGMGSLNNVTKLTTVTLENGQKAYLGNNGIYYAPNRKMPELPDPKQVIDVSKIQ